MNSSRDTLHIAAIVDISRGASLTIPDVGNRCVSVVVVDWPWLQRAEGPVTSTR